MSSTRESSPPCFWEQFICFLWKLVIQLHSLQHLLPIFQAWFNNTLHNYHIFHRHTQKLGGCILSSFSTFCLLNLYFNFRSIPKSLDTFKIMFSMWLFHLASLDKVTPKFVWLIVIGILFPLNEKLKLYQTSVLENTIISVLSGLKNINHFVNQATVSLKVVSRKRRLKCTLKRYDRFTNS